MNALKQLLVSSLALVAVSSASALTFTDVDVDGNNGEPDYYYMNQQYRQYKHWNNTFNLLDVGFDPLTMKIISATVFFAFADDGDQQYEKVRVKVENEKIWDRIEVDGSHYNAPYSYDWYSEDLSQSLVQALQDGVLDYQVKAMSGDYYLKEAKLVAQADWITPPEEDRVNVSDSGLTLALLGIGIASLLVLRKQMLSGQGA